jgi:hypothetical protein
MDIEALVVDALAQLGVHAQPASAAQDRGSADLVIEADGPTVPIRLKRRVLVDDEAARRLLAEDRSSAAALLVVGDRVTESARRILTEGGAGYLDLRGRLALRTDRMVISADVPSISERAERTDALAGKAGLEVATALLIQPKRSVAVRELARELKRSPSTVSDILAALRRDHLIDDSNVVVGTDLFWRVAERWPARRTLLAQLPMPGDATLIHALRLGLDDVPNTPGWALTDSAAAAAYGAPLGFRSGQVLDFFVPDESVVRRAINLLGTAQSASQARATIRVAPVPSIVRRRVDEENSHMEWPLAHPVFVALDLAQDVGRGREILAAWTPDSRWSRVW